MNKVLTLIMITGFLLNTQSLFAANVVGDTQGKVKSVNLKPVINGEHKLQVRFSIVENDRWGCHSGQGYVEVTDASSYVSTDQFKMILSMVLSAQASGKSLALDSPGANQCSMANMAWVVSD